MHASLASLVEQYRTNKAKYCFFETNCWHASNIGEQLMPVSGIDQLRHELAGHHIHDALLTNAYCLSYNAGVGNEQLLELIKEMNNWYGAIVWVPELASTRQELEVYLDRMIAGKIAAVRMFPKKLNHSLKNWQVGDVLAAMEARRLPLMLWHMETNWDTIQEICASYPKLPVIVEGNDQKLLYHSRSFIPLLAACPNLYIETHSLIQHGIIEHLVNERGIDRLLYGSYFPYNDPDSAMMMITDADIPEHAKYNIAGGHIRRLISQITTK